MSREGQGRPEAGCATIEDGLGGWAHVCCVGVGRSPSRSCSGRPSRPAFWMDSRWPPRTSSSGRPGRRSRCVPAGFGQTGHDHRDLAALFDLGFLEKLEAFIEPRGRLPYLEEVTSLVNVRSTWSGRAGRRGSARRHADDAEELAAFEERVLNALLRRPGSSDRQMTGVRVEVAVYGDGSVDGAGDDLGWAGSKRRGDASTKRLPVGSRERGRDRGDPPSPRDIRARTSRC